LGHNHTSTTIADLAIRGPFRFVFEQSRVPMALVDRDRRYVAANEAALELFQYPLEQVIGAFAGNSAGDGDRGTTDALWEQLLHTNELYGEGVIIHASGAPMRVTYVAHATAVAREWLALFVALSAHFEPDGAELINTAESDAKVPLGKPLTSREREVVRRLALGASSRQVAADLYLSPATVRSHVRTAMVKTNAHTRAQLVAIVLGDGLIGR
jgi:PAS domain S-box-containing protein